MEITWRDATTDDSGWKSLTAMIEDSSPCVMCRTVGYLLYHDKSLVKVVTTTDKHTAPNGDLSAMKGAVSWAIPTEWITKVRTLK